MNERDLLMALFERRLNVSSYEEAAQFVLKANRAIERMGPDPSQSPAVFLAEGP